MAKRILLFFFFYIGLFSCCRDTPDYWEIVSLEPLQLSSYTEDFTLEELQGDSIFIYFDVIINYTHKEAFVPITLGNQLYGWQPCEKGKLGSADPVIDLELTSDNDYQDIPPGESLEPHLNYGFTSKVEFLESFNKTSMYGTSYRIFWGFQLQGHPETEEHTFTLSLLTASGAEFTVTSEPVVWVP